MSALERPAATMLSIWCRTAMAVVAFDSATERSVHDGQRTPASIAAARCPAVGGEELNAPLPITSATTRTTTGRATRAQSGSGSERAQPLGAPAWSARAAFRNESRFFCVAGPTSTALTRPAGSMTKVVGGAVTP